MMKDFLKRNVSVLVVGVVTLVIFLVIIILAQTKDYYKPELIEVNKEAAFTKREEEIQSSIPEQSVNTNVDNLVDIKEVQESTPGEIDVKYGILEINYTENGFEPKNTSAQLNQLVRWVNKTQNTIELEQLTNNYIEFTNPITINPGSTFEFRVYKTKLWTYQEKNSRNFGSIIVSRGCTECDQ